PYMSEFSATGSLLFAAHLPAAYQSFTVLKAPWSATPSERPRVVVRAGAHGAITAYASWNGATGVAAWRLLGATQPKSLIPLAGVPRAGFETPIPLTVAHRYLAAQALGASGEVLGTSALARG